MLRGKGLKVKFHFTRWGIISLAVVVALGSIGITYAKLADTLKVGGTVPLVSSSNSFTWVVSNDDGTPNSQTPYGVIDPGDDGKDPNQPQTRGVALPEGGRYTEDVASTTASLVDPHNITVTVSNAYPYYYPTIFFGVKNSQAFPISIQSITIDENPATSDIYEDIPELTCNVTGIFVNQVLNPSDEVIGTLIIRVEQCALQNTTYNVRVTIVLVQAVQELGGTPGFWQNWKAHYKTAEMNSFLNAIYNDPINRTPGWVKNEIDINKNGTITITEMEAILDAGVGSKATDKSRFLRHYLATRLNAASGRLGWDNTHDITSISGYGYLGLASPAPATLAEIIAAIESKYSASGPINSPSGWSIKQRYDIMKNICDALNQEPPTI